MPGYPELAQFLEGDVWAFMDAAAPFLVRSYYQPSRFFTGSAFNSIGGPADAPDRLHEFTAEDIVAVSLLGVRIPGRSALVLLESRAGELNSLLSRIPATTTLWDADANVVSAESAADLLWKALRSINGIEWVTAHKLLARKRPLLLPVYDAVVRKALQPSADSFWLPLRNELLDRRGLLVDRLDEIRYEADLAEETSLLRILDVAIWMRNYGCLFLPEAERNGVAPLPFAPRPAR